MKQTHVIIAMAIALAVSLIMALPFTQRLENLSIDSLFWLRHQLQQTFPGLHTPDRPSDVVIIAIDEETYQQEQGGFANTPRVMWTPQYAQVLNAVIDAGADVVGFDIVLPTSIESKVKGYDREFLRTLFKHGRQGRIVLGKVQHHGKPVSPFPGHSYAVGNEKNIRLLNVGLSTVNTDGIIRHIPLWFDQSKRIDPSMSLELAARSLGTPVAHQANKALILNDSEVPVSKGGEMLINYNTQPGYVPAYSLADLHACSEKQDDYFRRHFEGKVVLLGAVLGLEDRKKTSARYANVREGTRVPERCVIAYEQDKYASIEVRDDIPGVYIHANAINNLLHGNALRELDKTDYALLSLPLAVCIGLVTIIFTPLRLGLTAGLLSIVWAAVVVLYFQKGLVLPLLNPLVAAAITFSAVLGFRFMVADKDKRLIKKAFGLYLEPAVIDKMMDEGSSPELGGEIRELTVWFSDIAGYTGISESLPPHELVEFLNQYFDEMTTIVKQHGGFVDKFVGDAIIAVFGAPQHDPDHALHAVKSALACDRRLKQLEDRFDLPEGIRVQARIGINTGEMLVGNIGSSNRLNYTIMGDEVNLAARLEGVNKMYGTTVMASDATLAKCHEKINCRELDCIRVKGRAKPVTVYELLQPEFAENTAMLEQFTTALQAYRDRDFAQALEGFDSLAASGDMAAQMFAQRTQTLIDNPPAPDWDGINTLTSK